MKIGILGAGEIGQAIKKVLEIKKDAEIAIWDKDPKRSTVDSLGSAVAGAEFVFLCVPSFAYSEILPLLTNSLTEGTIVVSLAKGMTDVGRSMSELLAESLFGRDWGVLAGPMIAEEIISGKSASAVFASSSSASAEKVKDLFSQTGLSIYASADFPGVSIASVLKNIYAVLFGVADGLDMGVNFKGRLFIAALSEMERVVFGLGGNPDTAKGLAGAGDLFATATSPDSRNHAFGMEIGRGKKPEFSGEGAISFSGLKIRLGNDMEKYPIISAFGKLLESPKTAHLIMEGIFNSV